MRRAHHHSCRNKYLGCQARVPCGGPLERNYDGWPEVVCAFDDGRFSFTCEDCCQADYCEDCGYPDHLGHHERCEIAPLFGTKAST